MSSTILNNFILSTSDKILGLSLSRELKKWRKIQWYSKNELEQLQLMGLNSILNYCYNNIPHYKNVFSQKNPQGFANIKSFGKMKAKQRDYYIENEIYLQMSSSILSVNLTDIQNKLEFMDYIEAVQVSRILPHTLMIHIVERSPVLLMNKADIITFMDKNGVLLPADKKSLRTFPVPVLSILDEKGSMDKYTVDIAESFQFLIDKYPLFYKNLSEVKIKEDVWEFYSDYNTKIYAHASCLTDQLNILKDFEKTLHPIRNLEDYHYIDLRIKNQVIVKEKYRQG